MAKAKKKATKKATKAKKTTTKKAGQAKRAAPEKKAKSGAKRKPNAAFMKPLTVSTALASIIGAGPFPRTEFVRALWKYIKKHDLQDPKNKRNINADEKLKAIFGGKAMAQVFS